ncbi:ABC transporter, phosphonate, periplasmic substrate-binding family protein [Ralstonia insidiosa]|uniref:ABC transporter, phosphonate, periplasmic substrate-binding family protein n=1 Tax=Ralstonia insidiosa TaxID=190721 RepID=A0AAC9FT00_9RALS|nr:MULTISPECIES: amino acid ABC transporter substrate-binding protein [Ralstonia]ANH75652.1 ABC transporter, phosphonate, periplasmic substrate-binding family protein [Ralstonia insidiosa]EPX99499.1 glutamate/aspartate ABC transporter substrate-binding protein [Ralstonia sp. AU12-08]MBY4705165.1 amino acid ABC transporter substrate-binding protein [Ralstonia insidiosa]GAQ29291.1 ABC transporter periplasmic protein [Ralstonia sp. NT80]
MSSSALPIVSRALAALLLQLSIAVATPAQAQSPTPVLDQIRQSGTITLGYREGAVPFSFSDAKGQPAGYAVDLCLRVAEAAQRRLNLPELKVRWLPLTAQSRVPAVVNGLVAIDCAPNTITAERKKQVDFSLAYYVSAVRMLVRTDSGIQSFDDMRGKTVVTSAGSTSDRHVRRLKDQYGYREVYAKDHVESFLMLDTGRAQAFVLDDVVLYGLRANAKTPAQYEVVGPTLSVERNALMLSRADAQWKALVDQTLAALFASPDVLALQKRWFQQPIGARGIVLGLTPSPEVLAAWKHPSDEAVE